MKLKYKWMIVLLLFICVGIWASAMQATEQVVSKDVTIGQGQIVEDDLILAGNTVTLQGEAKEDLIVAGSEVTIAGAVRGYILAAGSNVTVNGSVGNDLIVAGAKLKLNAPVADNAIMAGGEIHLQPNAVVQHDAMLAGGTVEIAGKIERNLKLAAGEARLASEIGGSVEAHVGKLKILPGAVIRGNLKVYSPAPPEVASQAQVLGRLDYIQVEQEGWAKSWFKRWIYSFLALSLVGLVAIFLATKWTDGVAAIFLQRPGATLLTGLGGIILIPLAALLLLATVIGIPLAFIMLALFAVALLLTGVLASWLAGGWLLKQFQREPAARWARMIVGALAVSLLVSLPWIGALIGLLVVLGGLGALLLERRATLHSAPV